MKDDISKFAYACMKKSQWEKNGRVGYSRKYWNIIRFIYLRLKEENRLGELLELLDHENPHVRVWAGAYTLEIDPKRAEKALEDLASKRGPAAFDARITLKEWRAGRLLL